MTGPPPGLRIAITGSTGLLGTALVAALQAGGQRVTRLVRRASAGPDQISWDPRAPGGGIAPGALDGLDAVIHLAGAGVADHRWTPAYQQEIRASRVMGTRALAAALAAAGPRPAVLLAGSAIGWYGDTGGREVDESAPAGQGFLADVVRDWEAAAQPARQAGIRVVNMRTGIVFTRQGGVLARADLAGPVNLTTPYPVTNAELTRALAAAVNRPALLTVPALALRLALGGVTSDLLSSARVLPRRLTEAGYQFQFPELPAALAAELAAPPAA